MRTTVMIDGDFSPYDSSALVEISKFDNEATFRVSVDPPDGRELITYEIPFEVVVRLALRYVDPDYRKDVAKALEREVDALKAEVA